jgi:biotin operon repressor
MIDQGFISLHRSILKWEWYHDLNTKSLFLHLLLTANWEPQKWQGITVERGQRVCSLPSLSKETGLSVRSIRTAIEHLKSTGELTDASTSKYRIITIKNYDLYQTPTDEATGDRQASDRQATGDRQQLNKANNYNKSNNDNKKNVGHFTPPTLSEVSDYCIERKNSIDPQRFIDYYTANGWIVGKTKMKDWKAAVRNWERRDSGGTAGGKTETTASDEPIRKLPGATYL